jgi:hypothetical protein
VNQWMASLKNLKSYWPHPFSVTHLFWSHLSLQSDRSVGRECGGKHFWNWLNIRQICDWLSELGKVWSSVSYIVEGLTGRSFRKVDWINWDLHVSRSLFFLKIFLNQFMSRQGHHQKAEVSIIYWTVSDCGSQKNDRTWFGENCSRQITDRQSKSFSVEPTKQMIVVIHVIDERRSHDKDERGSRGILRWGLVWVRGRQPWSRRQRR